MAGFFFLGGSLPKLPHHEPAESITRAGFELLSWSQHAQCYNNGNSNITTNKKLNSVVEGDEIGSFSLGVGPAALTNLGFDEQLLTTVALSMRGGHTGMNCQDCGNQAKKDCQHMRCRTCCKSRGLPCETHVKSTWVPAAKRRERQEQIAAAMQIEREPVEEHQGFRIEKPKRTRDHRRSNDNNNQLMLPVANHIIPTASTGFQVAEFPDGLNSPALFRCVRVSSVDNSDEEYAYETAVNIGGHIFKGILYDRGADNTNPLAGEASSAGGNRTQPLNFITAAATNTATATGVVAATNNPNVSTMMDPSLVYPAHLNAFMARTQFFPPPRS